MTLGTESFAAACWVTWAFASVSAGSVTHPRRSANRMAAVPLVMDDLLSNERVVRGKKSIMGRS
jgi:hypothetical protein